MELLLRGYVLTLRLEDAGKITVEEVPACPGACGQCKGGCA